MAKAKREVVLIFEWDGATVHKEAIGFTGKSCVAETSFLEKALGMSENRVYKQDFHTEAGGDNKIKVLKVKTQ